MGSSLWIFHSRIVHNILAFFPPLLFAGEIIHIIHI